MLGLSKHERALVLALVWVFSFVILTALFCFLSAGTVTLTLMLKEIGLGLGIKLLFCTTIVIIVFLYPSFTLSDVKSSTAGDGQHGTAHWSTKAEISQYYEIVRPKHEMIPGMVVGLDEAGKWVVDTSDQSMLIMAPPGSGKTTRIIIPTIYYNASVNMHTQGQGASFICTDMKGELVEKCGSMLVESGYCIASLDLRNPFKSRFFNLLNNTNKFMERYLGAASEEERLVNYGKAERYAKILAQSIVHSVDTSSTSDSGQYFNDTAQGLLTGLILLVSQYACDQRQKHILSVFNLMIELNGVSESAAAPNTVQRNKLSELLEHIDDERIRSHVGAAMSADIRSSMNIFSSALGKLVGLIDAELEQMISRHSPELNDLDFIQKPTAIFIICPDENPTRYFFGSLFLRYFLNDLIAQARDTKGGALPRPVLCLWDEFGNMPAIKDVDVLFSAIRSAGVRIAAVIQSLGQLRKNYSETTANIICSTCQITMTTQVAPMDRKTAEEISKSLGNRTVQSGSVSVGKSEHKTVQLMSRPLLTPDELMNLPTGDFVVQKIGCHPMRTKLRYYTDYLQRHPAYEAAARANEVVPIQRMSAEDVKNISKSNRRLTLGMFG